MDRWLYWLHPSRAYGGIFSAVCKLGHMNRMRRGRDVSLLRVCKLLSINILLISFCFTQSGCIDFIARAITDPSGLVADIGAATAESSARSILSDNDVGSLSQMEQSVSRLDDMIARTNDPSAMQELQALRDHVAKGVEQTQLESVTEDVSGLGDGPHGFSQAAWAKRQHSRRLGELYADPALVAHQPYQQWPKRSFDSVRTNNFERWAPPLNEMDYREHDSVSAARPWSQSIEPDPSYGFAIDPHTGFIRSGFLEIRVRYYKLMISLEVANRPLTAIYLLIRFLAGKSV